METQNTPLENQLTDALIALKNSTDWFMIPYDVKQQVQAALIMAGELDQELV